MSLANFINKETAPIGSQPIQQEPSDFTDILFKSFTSTLQNFNSNSRAKLIDEEKNERAKLFQDLTGEKLDPTKATGYVPFEEPSAQDFLELGSMKILQRKEEYENQFIEQYVQELKNKEPEKYKSILSQEELEEKARNKANLSRREFEEASKRSSGFTRFTASFLGGLGATALDPINVATIPFGAARGASILRTVATEAAINAGTEAVTQPFVAKWQKELGQEYGFNEMAENVGFAALFGGSFAGVVKGAKPSAMFVFDKMSKMKNLKPSERLTASYMSKVAHLKEALPFVRNKTPIEAKKHYDSVKAVSEAFENGKKVEPNDVKITEAEFISLDTKPKRGDTDIEKTRLAEIERFKEQDVIQESQIETPVYKIETLPQQILDKVENKILDNKKISKVDFEPEELEILKSAGIKPNAAGKINEKPLLKERKKRQESNTLVDTIGKERQHIEDFNNAKNIKTLRNQNLNKQEVDLKNTLKKENILDDNIEPSFMDRVLDESNSPQFIQAEDINFRALAEENPDLLISLEDGEFRIGDLLEMFDNDENFIKQITTCTIG